jgi:hypothetical protein
VSAHSALSGIILIEIKQLNQSFEKKMLTLLLDIDIGVLFIIFMSQEKVNIRMGKILVVKRWKKVV